MRRSLDICPQVWAHPPYRSLSQGPRKGYGQPPHHKLTVTFHRSRRAPLPSEASVATSLISSSLVRSQMFKLTSSQGEQALLRPPVSAGHCQTKEPAGGGAGRWSWEALLFGRAFS